MGGTQAQPDTWVRIPVMLRAIVVGLLVGMIAANMRPILLLKPGMPLPAAVACSFHR